MPKGAGEWATEPNLRRPVRPVSTSRGHRGGRGGARVPPDHQWAQAISVRPPVGSRNGYGAQAIAERRGFGEPGVGLRHRPSTLNSAKNVWTAGTKRRLWRLGIVVSEVRGHS